jgi:hypothetical protein
MNQSTGSKPVGAGPSAPHPYLPQVVIYSRGVVRLHRNAETGENPTIVGGDLATYASRDGPLTGS